MVVKNRGCTNSFDDCADPGGPTHVGFVGDALYDDFSVRDTSTATLQSRIAGFSFAEAFESATLGLGGGVLAGGTVLGDTAHIFMSGGTIGAGDSGLTLFGHSTGLITLAGFATTDSKYSTTLGSSLPVASATLSSRSKETVDRSGYSIAQLQKSRGGSSPICA